MFDIPRNSIVPVSDIEVRLEPGQHPFEATNAEAIEANWQREVAANAALFDGTIVLLAGLAYAGGRLTGRCHAVRYATLLYWRRSRPQGAEHAFAHAALVSSDGALVAIRMAAHTANPGRIYFAAGSFEPFDFRDGLVDVEANMAREVGEETGLDISATPHDPSYHLYSRNSATVIFRRCYLDETAEQIAARIAAFVASEEQSEIDGAVVIRSPDDFPDGAMPYMRAIVDWHFGGN
ncbi:NUDIX hydrolase [Mesorhizobium sp. CN2-181]|uniref:NUDIX hydrolase n=1 Tax=Mesorhizobium yinganensis TaxID=3157707 RepID=UPI0032B7906A